MKYKKVQIMDTKHNLHLFMCPNRLYVPALKGICNNALKKACVMMIEKDRGTSTQQMFTTQTCCASAM